MPGIANRTSYPSSHRQRTSSRPPIKKVKTYQLCSCKDGRLFMVSPSSSCVADYHICASSQAIKVDIESKPIRHLVGSAFNSVQPRANEPLILCRNNIKAFICADNLLLYKFFVFHCGIFKNKKRIKCMNFMNDIQQTLKKLSTFILGKVRVLQLGVFKI